MGGAQESSLKYGGTLDSNLGADLCLNGPYYQ